MDPTVKALKEKLEKEGEQKAAEIVQTNTNSDPNAAAQQCANMVAQGITEFREKTGRQMTYSEMRELYG
jgi:hypothetical protein